MLSAAAAVLSFWQQALVLSFWQQAGASALAFSVLDWVLPEQATSIAATAAIANRFFIIVYLINVVVVTPVKTPQSYPFSDMKVQP